MPPYDPNFDHRRSIRFRHYNYRWAGSYFITICSNGRRSVFGHVGDNVMQLNSWGHIAHDMWTETAVHFHAVSIDTFVVMPNHTHAIITISSPDAVGAGFPRPSGPPPAESATPNSAGPSLGQIIGFYKWMTTKRINEIRGTPGRSLWQRNYFEHVIRGQRSYEAIGEYIVTNPARWREDSLNSDA